MFSLIALYLTIEIFTFSPDFHHQTVWHLVNTIFSLIVTIASASVFFTSKENNRQIKVFQKNQFVKMEINFPSLQMEYNLRDNTYFHEVAHPLSISKYRTNGKDFTPSARPIIFCCTIVSFKFVT